MLFSIFLFLLIPTTFALSVLPTPTPKPTIASAFPASTTIGIPKPTSPPLVERCEGGDCTFGGTGTTLQASVVTSTILSTTSVPCYITTYITNSETRTETIYSTEIITSTITKEGTVFIIQYSPTPVLMSTPITSVMEITNTWWSYWLTSSGSGYQVTSKGQDSTIYGGGSNTVTKGGNDNGNDWKPTSSDKGWNGGSNVGTGTGTAWTHVNANNAVISSSVPVAGVTVGSNDGWGSSAGTGTQVNGGLVNWNDACRRTSSVGWEMKATFYTTITIVIVWEVTHFLA
ncbi:uncharacterized protein IL334_005868 [Kwoniella shivajii]|uniref:Uncharacterized protein n=1 Tax=Kwoniella shivajii TaxID=564305 RepID=A0ABZ1D7E8_9TREE|nr:hypothetical protein IL334_005868 [Kwoniella shivajii]